ncbi:cytochrome P450 [Mycena maculata]|uniref:Cytochrome P450 n=1 Tax=Mycena maculata TaxID=230809 RepID=A0AAD7JW89_9AGAR|nr:cytochrome P450 [Mycena maculata]
MASEYLQNLTQNFAAVSASLLVLGLAVVSLRKSSSGRPPVVPYWLPWIGSAVSLGKDPDGFFKKAVDTLGPVFRVKAAGRDMIYVTSPELINVLYRNAKTYDFVPIRLEISETVFQIPIPQMTRVVDHYYPDHHRLLSPKSIGPILDRYAQYAFEDLTPKIASMNGKAVNLFDLLIPPAFTAASAAFFGRELPAQELYSDFAEFNDAFHLITAGIPRWMMPAPHRAWDKVIAAVEEYYKGVKEKDLDEVPELVRLTIETCTPAGLSDRIAACLLAGDLWAMEANAIWAAYWFVVELLQRPAEYELVLQELDTVRNAWIGAHSDTPLSSTTFADFMRDSANSLPLMSSGLLECLRLRTSTFSIRRVAEPAELGGYKLDVGEQLICATRSVHLDAEVHEDPYDFVLDRYVEGPLKKATKNGKTVPNHSMPFGGGISMCEGRHFAQSEIKTFTALLLTYCTLEVAFTETWPEMRMDRLGVGIISPKGDVSVLVKQRNL